MVKLTHIPSKFRLHSHKVNYGSGGGGSGQQSVTGFPETDDNNSYWVIKAPHDQVIPQGTIIKSGDVIRLQHLSTKKNLHSHLAVSPITKQNEVSCFGEEGLGDTGDNWRVEFVKNHEGDSIWARNDIIRLVHVDTKAFLHASPNAKYQNPIPGQIEISATSKKSEDSTWMVEEGIYFEIRNDE